MESGFISRTGTAVRVAWTDGFVRRLATDASWGVGATGVEFALSLAETALVARALDIADYGRLALVIGAITSVKLLVDVRAWEAATRYLADFLAKGQLGLALTTPDQGFREGSFRDPVRTCLGVRVGTGAA